MVDWSNKLNDILTINHREILLDAGRISKKIADELAEREFEKYSAKQREIDSAKSLKELENDLKKSRIKRWKRKNKKLFSLRVKLSPDFQSTAPQIIKKLHCVRPSEYVKSIIINVLPSLE
jgi:hypothetical protein